MLKEPYNDVLGCLKEAFREYLDEILDDPAWLSGNAPALIQTLRATAAWLELDYEALLVELGSEFEIERLSQLEKG